MVYSHYLWRQCLYVIDNQVISELDLFCDPRLPQVRKYAVTRQRAGFRSSDGAWKKGSALASIPPLG